MMLADVWRGTRDAETSASYHTPLVMHHALSLSIIRGRGDVVTRFILLLSADAYAMQLCKQGLGSCHTARRRLEVLPIDNNAETAKPRSRKRKSPRSRRPPMRRSG